MIKPPETQPRESFDEPRGGNAFWFTLFSSDKTSTRGMSAGVMVKPPNGGCLEPHRHEQAEIYFIASDAGLLTIDGTESCIVVGTAAFIPNNAKRSLRNDGHEDLRVFYIYIYSQRTASPTSSIALTEGNNAKLRRFISPQAALDCYQSASEIVCAGLQLRPMADPRSIKGAGRLETELPKRIWSCDPE